MSEREVLFEADPDNHPEDRPLMEFRLTYEGPLLATQHDATGSTLYRANQRENRHFIRREISRQLKTLWDVTPFLRTGERGGPSALLLEQGQSSSVYKREVLAQRYAMFGFNFVPLVTRELELICGLDVLFLRPDRPGDVVWRGDIDNRMKTLVDALKIPEANEDYASRVPTEDEKPIYCLLADDRLITKLAVESDQLLDVKAPNAVKLVISVRLRPYELHLGNIQFG